MPVPIKQTSKGTINKKAGSVVDRIKAIGKEDSFMKILLYGVSGSGKTTFWATMPGPILAVICSGGNNTGETRSINTPEYRKKIKIVTLNDSSELKDLVEYAASSEAFKTIVLDHVSGLQDLILKEILGLDEIPAQKGWGLASQQQYGQCTAQAKEYLRALLNLNCNVAIIGQERTFGGKDDGLNSDIIQPTVGPAVVPSLAGWLNPACDYILQMYKRPRMITTYTTMGTGDKAKKIATVKRGKGVMYCARCEPHDTFITKFRVPRGIELPEYVEDPTYDKLIKIIKGE